MADRDLSRYRIMASYVLKCHKQRTKTHLVLLKVDDAVGDDHFLEHLSFNMLHLRHVVTRRRHPVDRRGHAVDRRRHAVDRRGHPMDRRRHPMDRRGNGGLQHGQTDLVLDHGLGDREGQVWQLWRRGGGRGRLTRGFCDCEGPERGGGGRRGDHG